MINATAPSTATANPIHVHSLMPRNVVRSDTMRKLPRRPMRLKVLCVLLLATSCATAQRAGSAAKEAIIDCAKQDGPAIVAGVAHFGARAIIDGHIDWEAIETAAKGAGLGVGSCAVAEFLRAYKRLAKEQIAARGGEPDAVVQGQAVLARLSGGAGVKLADGTVMQ